MRSVRIGRKTCAASSLRISAGRSPTSLSALKPVAALFKKAMTNRKEPFTGKMLANMKGI
jgi:hypothetical protein